MTTETSNTTTAATLTEKELWALFVEHTMKTTLSMGPTIEQYKPDDYLRDPGVWDCLDDFANGLADGVAAVDEPGLELSRRMEEIEKYLGLLKTVHEDFQCLKGALAFDNEDDEERFRMPTIHSAEAA